MSRDLQYFVYILSNWRDSTFYTGVINNLEPRVYEHQEGVNKKASRRNIIVVS